MVGRDSKPLSSTPRHAHRLTPLCHPLTLSLSRHPTLSPPPQARSRPLSVLLASPPSPIPLLGAHVLR
eukprot:1549581-Prymnesium_polylepis.1